MPTTALVSMLVLLVHLLCAESQQTDKPPLASADRIRALHGQRRQLLREALELLEKPAAAEFDVDKFRLQRITQIDLLAVELEISATPAERQAALASSLKHLRKLEQALGAQKSLDSRVAAESLATRSERLGVELRLAKETNVGASELVRTLSAQRREVLGELLHEMAENAAAGHDHPTFLTAFMAAHDKLLDVELEAARQPDERLDVGEALRKRLETLENKLREQPDFDLVAPIHAEYVRAARLGVEIRMMKGAHDTPTGLMNDLYWTQCRSLDRACGLLAKRGSTNAAIVWILEHSALIARAKLPSALALCKSPVQRLAVLHTTRTAFDIWEYRALEGAVRDPVLAAHERRARAARLEIDIMIEQEKLLAK